MILPLLVFIVVLIAIIYSYFTQENFEGSFAIPIDITPKDQYIGSSTEQTITTSSSEIIDPEDEDEDFEDTADLELEAQTTELKFKLNKSISSLESSITSSAILEGFTNNEELSIADKLIKTIKESITSSFSVNESDIDVTLNSSRTKTEVSIKISEHYTDQELVIKVNTFKSLLFGSANKIEISHKGNNVRLNLVEYTTSQEEGNTFIKFKSNPGLPDINRQTTQTTVTTSVSDLELTDDKILSKKACVHTEDKCNIGYEPFSYMELDSINPSTKKNYTESEKKQKLSQFSERCSNNPDAEEKMCCDPNDYKLQRIYNELPDDLRNKYKNIVVDSCNNKLNQIKVCKSDNSNCTNPNDIIRNASAYELCKLQNVTEADINNEGVVNDEKLVPDCYEGKCSFEGKLLQVNPLDNNEKTTNHYYLIDAVKNNNLEYIKSYYSEPLNNVNEKLKYGYPGNTILHQAVYDDVDKIVEYLLTKTPNLSIPNKDGNTAFHIACFRGNYNSIHKLIKLGASINCTNNMKDTPLHCAVRSGSYNSVLILLNNGASAVLSHRNQHGETPLHTSVVGKKKNFKIVEVLVDHGSDIHNINNYDNTILGSLLKSRESVVRERIRTYLQKMYYNKYDEDNYNKLLKKHPEVRPFEIETDLPDHLSDKEFNDYDSSINYKKLITYEDEYADNKDLYVDKNTRGIKSNIDSRYFDNRNVQNISASNNNNGEFNTDERNEVNIYDLNEDDQEEEEEYTEENVEVETFQNKNNLNENTNTNINANTIYTDANKTSKKKTWDKYLIYGSFYTLLAFIIILSVLYLKRTKVYR